MILLEFEEFLFVRLVLFLIPLLLVMFLFPSVVVTYSTKAHRRHQAHRAVLVRTKGGADRARPTRRGLHVIITFVLSVLLSFYLLFLRLRPCYLVSILSK